MTHFTGQPHGKCWWYTGKGSKCWNSWRQLAPSATKVNHKPDWIWLVYTKKLHSGKSTSLNLITMWVRRPSETNKMECAIHLCHSKCSPRDHIQTAFMTLILLFTHLSECYLCIFDIHVISFLLVRFINEPSMHVPFLFVYPVKYFQCG